MISFYFMYFILFKIDELIIFSSYGKSFDIFGSIINQGIGAGKKQFDVHFHGLSPHFFRPKIEKTRPIKGEMYRKVITSHQSRHFFL